MNLILDKRLLLVGEQRTCKTCGVTKLLIDNFRFHSFNNSFCRECLDCANYKRRKKNRFFRKKYKEISVSENSKTCTNCLKTFDKDEAFFKDSKYKLYPTCKICYNNIRGKDYNKRCTIQKLYDENNRGRYVLRTTQKFDKSKNLQNDLTVEFIVKKLKNPCIYCSFPSTGLDRLNNGLGHLQSNCVPCCKMCNFTRQDQYTYEEMKILGPYISLIKKLRETP